MMEEHEIQRRLERIEDELGIDPDESAFRERCESFAGMRGNIEFVEQTDKYEAVFNLTDELKQAHIESLQHHFERFWIDLENNRLEVSGVNEL